MMIALAVVRAQMGKNETFVFTYKGNPVEWANNTAWRNALKRADIKDFRWHDYVTLGRAGTFRMVHLFMYYRS